MRPDSSGRGWPRRWPAPATRWSALDAMLAAAHGPDAELPRRCAAGRRPRRAALAPLLEGVDVVCHQAAVVGAGVDAADAPSYGSHNDFGTAVLLAEMFAAGCRRLVLASSMVVYGQGRYECPRTRARSTRCRAREPTSTPGSSSTVARSAGSRCGGGWSTRTRRFGRAVCTRRARPRRSTTRWRGPSRRAARWSRCAITTSTAPACRATRRTPGWRPSSAPSSKQATCQGFSRTVGRCATSSTSTTSPRPTSAAVRREAGRLLGVQRLLRATDLDPRDGHRAV